MQMRLKWLPQAIALLDKIYDFYATKSEQAASKLYNRLLDSANPLKIFPQAGIVEPLIQEYNKCFRSLAVEKHYKLIYTITDDLIEIHAIWDCRQEENKLKDIFH